MKRAACAAVLAFSACAGVKDHPLPAAARASLAIASVDPLAESFDVPFKQAGRSAGMAHIQKLDAVSHSVSLSVGNKPPCRIDKSFEELLRRITAVGTVDVFGRGDEELFLLNEDGGKELHEEILMLVDPRDCGVSGVDIAIQHQATNPVTAQTPLGRFQDTQDVMRRPERRFLNAIKYRYGYLGQEDIERDKNNPRYAYYFWARDNGGMSETKMTMRRYKGKPPSGGTVMSVIQDGPVTYNAEFHAGVVAYDSAKDEHYVVFHPDDMYAWPKILKKMGPYLLIGTSGEGLAAIDLRNFWIKRFRFSGRDANVESIDDDGGKILVNGARSLTLPGL